MKKISFLLVVVFILLSCSREETFTITTENGIKIINNSGLLNKPDKIVELEELFTIQGYDDSLNPNNISFYCVTSLQVANDGTLFLFDDLSGKCFKYSTEGELLLDFAGKGNGPGEITKCNNNMLFVVNENIIITDYLFLKYYDLNGKYVTQSHESGLVQFMAELDQNDYMKVCRKMESRGENVQNEYFIIDDIIKYNSSSEELTSLDQKIETSFKEYKESDVSNSFINEFTLAKSNNQLFITRRSKQEYSIDCYDFNFQKLMTIVKYFSGEAYSSAEMDFINENFVGDYISEEKFEDIFDTELSINYLHYDDANDLLLVERPPSLFTQSVTFDIFKTGIFLNSFDVPISEEDYNPMNQEFMFHVHDGRFYHYSDEENKLTIYKLKYNNC